MGHGLNTDSGRVAFAFWIRVMEIHCNTRNIHLELQPLTVCRHKFKNKGGSDTVKAALCSCCKCVFSFPIGRKRVSVCAVYIHVQFRVMLLTEGDSQC